MLHINELPDIILQQVFRHAFHEDLDNTKNWKFILPMLAVCSHWRNAGKKIIYTTVIIRDHEEAKDVPQPQADSDQFFPPILAVLTDNIHLVRHLCITITTISAIAQLAGQIEELLGGQSKIGKWAGVRQLTIKANIYQNGNDFGTHNTETSDMDQKVAYIAQYLSYGLPNITDLDFSALSCQPAARLGSLIVAAYGNQWKSINSDSDVFSSIASVSSKQLTKMQTSLTENTNKLIFGNCINTLTILILKDLPANFSWGAFSDFADTNILLFPSLHSLQLQYSVESTSSNTWEHNYILQQGINPATPIQVVFPVLNELCLILPNIESVQNVLCYSTYHWPNVTKLKLFGLDSSGMFADFNNDIALRNLGIMQDAIVNKMPHVEALKIDGFLVNSLDSMLCEQLSNHYAKQLRYLANYHSAINLDLRMTRSLEYLSINLTLQTSIALATACADTLKTIKLENTPHEFSWSSLFDADTEKHAICFSRLEHLHIMYTDYTVEFGTDCRNFEKFQKNPYGIYAVDCPRLKELTLVGCSYSGLQSIMCPGDKEWSMLQKLEIELHLDTTKQSFDMSFYKNIDILLSTFSRRIVEKMPNINSLSLYDCASTSEVAFFSYLIDAYADQLKNMYSNVPQCLCTFRDAQQLKSLNINLKDSKSVSPIHSQSLELIKYINVPSQFKWDIFSADTETKDIHLDDLKMLVLASGPNKTSESSAENNYYLNAFSNIYLPRISYISICMNIRDVQSGAAKLFFSDVATVNLIGQVSSLPLLGESAKCHIGYLNIDKICASETDENYFYNFTNSWLGNNAAISDCRLNLDNVTFNLDPNRIMWTGLSKLSILQNIELDNAFQIMSQLPHLTHLTLQSVSSDECSEDKCILNSLNCDDLEWTSSIKSLKIFKASSKSNQESVVVKIAQFILSASTLEHVALGKTLKSNVEHMLQQNELTATHMQNIEFTTYYMWSFVSI